MLIGHDPIPRDVFVNGESGLTALGQRNVNRPRGEFGVDLNGLVGEAQEPESSRNEGGPHKPEDSVPATRTRPSSAPPASERSFPAFTHRSRMGDTHGGEYPVASR